jgi:long-chain acyl-CoA synthetase
VTVASPPTGYVPIEIADCVRSSARRVPGKVALQEGDRTLTYSALVERIDRVANGAVHDLGLAPGQHAAVFAPNCMEYFEVTLGLASADVPAVLVNARATTEELEQICDDSEARVLFVHESLKEVARSADLGVDRIVVVGGDYEDWLAQARPVRPDVRPDELNTFLIPYTTGSTGRPKGVLISHRSRVLLAYTVAGVFRFAADNRSLVVAPLHHVATYLWGLAPLFFDGYCAIQPIFHPEILLRSLSRLEINTVRVVPTHLSAIAELGTATLRRYDISALHSLVSGGAPLPAQLKERIVTELGDSILFESYGATETGAIALLGPADQLRKPESVGVPLPCTTVKLVDADGAEVGPGEIGELYCRTPFLFNGYWNQPEETARCFRDGYVSVGDLARMDDEGYIFLVDRTDNKIVTGGVNVHPSEVERALERHPAVAEVAVFAVPDPHSGEALRAAVALRAGHEPTEETAQALRSFCAQNLAQHKRPQAFDFVDSLPRNAAGEIVRHPLREPFWAGRDRQIA